MFSRVDARLGMGTGRMVIVRVQWADAERGGLRTLRVRGRSLDDICRIISSTLDCTPQNGSGNAAPSAPFTAVANAIAPASKNGPRLNRRPLGARRSPKKTNGCRSLPSLSASPGNGSAAGPALVCEAHAATVLWTGEVPAGRFLPATTLVQVQVRTRKVTLRLAGHPGLEIGTLVNVGGLNGSGEVFAAQLYADAENHVTLYIKERLF